MSSSAAPVIRRNGFTNETLDWASWLRPVDVAQATPLQLQVLDESHPQSRTSAYYLTLVHQPLMLRHRSAAYNAIMYAPGGLPRTERELGALVVSVTNGCVYCTSVHAQRYAQLARRADTVEQVFDDPSTAGSTRARTRHRPLRAGGDAAAAVALARRHRAASRAGPERRGRDRPAARHRHLRLGQPADAQPGRAGGPGRVLTRARRPRDAAGPGLPSACRNRPRRCNRIAPPDDMPADASPDDFESGLKPLWLRAQDGDDAAYREALARIATRLRGYLRRRMQSLPDELEDLVQETLLALHLQRGTYDASVPVSAWVLAIAATSWWTCGAAAAAATTATTPWTTWTRRCWWPSPTRPRRSAISTACCSSCRRRSARRSC
jgi:uncharacterized peroxidase-related enzyme